MFEYVKLTDGVEENVRRFLCVEFIGLICRPRCVDAITKSFEPFSYFPRTHRRLFFFAIAPGRVFSW